jgi:hypothetical protein
MIPIGPRGLQIASVASPKSPAKAIIQRPDHSVPPITGSLSYGLFFIPSPPTDPEKAQAIWKPSPDGKSQYAVAMRGAIGLGDLVVDCNMGTRVSLPWLSYAFNEPEFFVLSGNPFGSVVDVTSPVGELVDAHVSGGILYVNWQEDSFKAGDTVAIAFGAPEAPAWTMMAFGFCFSWGRRLSASSGPAICALSAGIRQMAAGGTDNVRHSVGCDKRSPSRQEADDV